VAKVMGLRGRPSGIDTSSEDHIKCLEIAQEIFNVFSTQDTRIGLAHAASLCRRFFLDRL